MGPVTTFDEYTELCERAPFRNGINGLVTLHVFTAPGKTRVLEVYVGQKQLHALYFFGVLRGRDLVTTEIYDAITMSMDAEKILPGIRTELAGTLSPYLSHGASDVIAWVRGEARDDLKATEE